MSERENPSPSRPSTTWAPLAVLITLVVAGVALVYAGWKPEAIVGFLSGIAGLGAVVVAQLKSNAQQTETLQRIDRQVNGELDRRIREGARKAAEDALRAIGHPPKTPPPPGRKGR